MKLGNMRISQPVIHLNSDDTTLYDITNMYYDDICIYNAELTSNENTP